MTETLQILEKVNAFYASAWDKLIIGAGALIALIGVVVPYLIAKIQKQEKEKIIAEAEKISQEQSHKLYNLAKNDIEKATKQFNQELQTVFEKAAKGTELVANATCMSLADLWFDRFLCESDISKRGKAICTAYTMSLFSKNKILSDQLSPTFLEFLLLVNKTGDKKQKTELAKNIKINLSCHFNKTFREENAAAFAFIDEFVRNNFERMPSD